MFIGLGLALVIKYNRLVDDGGPYVVTDYVITDYVQAAP